MAASRKLKKHFCLRRYVFLSRVKKEWLAVAHGERSIESEIDRKKRVHDETVDDKLKCTMKKN